MKLSHQFVVPAYGDSPYLPACLASVCAQRSESKVIVTTSTPSKYISGIAESYGVPVHVGEGDRRIATNWNFGLSCATEELVTLAHQDDVYYPDFAEQTRRLFNATPSASLCFTDYEEIDDRGHSLPSGRLLAVKRMLRCLAVGGSEIVNSRSRRRRLLAFGSVIPCPSVSLNRGAVPEFRFSDDYEINLDWDAWWRLHALDNPFVLSRRILMGHRLHSGAETSRSKRDGRRQTEDQRMFGRIWPRPVAQALATVYRFSY